MHANINQKFGSVWKHLTSFQKNWERKAPYRVVVTRKNRVDGQASSEGAPLISIRRVKQAHSVITLVGIWENCRRRKDQYYADSKGTRHRTSLKTRNMLSFTRWSHGIDGKRPWPNRADKIRLLCLRIQYKNWIRPKARSHTILKFLNQ